MLTVIERLRPRFDVVSYGALEYDADGRFPLFVLKNRAWNDALPGARCRAPRCSTNIGVLSVAQLGGRAPPTPALRHAQTMCSWRSR